MKYKLNVSRDVDTDEPGVFILNLPKGWRLDEPVFGNDVQHVMGFDSMKELRTYIKDGVVPCNCTGCTE